MPGSSRFSIALKPKSVRHEDNESSLTILLYFVFLLTKVLDFEFKMLEALDFDINIPLPHHFLDRAFAACNDLTLTGKAKVRFFLTIGIKN